MMVDSIIYKINTMKNTFLILLFSFFLLNSCDDDPAGSTADYVGFEIDFSQGVDAAISTPIEVKVYSTTVSSSDRSFSIGVDTDLTSLNASAYDVPTSVTIPANSNEGAFTVNINGPSVGSGGNLVLSFGDDNSIFTGDNMTLSVFPVCFDNTANLTLTLAITFDSWPEEIYWVLTGSSGVVAESVTPAAYGAYAGLSGGISQDFCLPNDTYSFTIYDAYGDGAGPYSLTFSDGTIVHSSDGAYGYGEAIDFEL